MMQYPFIPKSKDALAMLKLPRSACPDIWMCMSRKKWSKSWSNTEDPVSLLDRKLCHTKLGMPICASKACQFWSVYVDGIRLDEHV